MTQGIETLDIIEPWLIDRLKNDSALNALVGGKIANDQSVITLEPPYLFLGHISTRDILGIGTVRIDTDNLYGIRAVTRSGSFVSGRGIMRVVDGLLHGQIVTTSNGSLTCVRDAPFHYPETRDGVQFMHVGANYRFRAASG